MSANLWGADVVCAKMFERLTGVIARLALRMDKHESSKVQIPSTVATRTVDGISCSQQVRATRHSENLLSPVYGVGKLPASAAG